MERCIAHPEREAAAACAACGRPFCEECLEKGHDPPRCLDCAILGAAAETASEAPPERPPAAAPRRRLPVALAVLAALVAAAAVALLVQRGAVGGPAPAVAPEAAATADLFLVEEVVADLMEEGGGVPDAERLAAALPDDLAAEVRAGALTVEAGEGGVVIRWRTRGRELVLRPAEGGSEVTEGGGP